MKNKKHKIFLWSILTGAFALVSIAGVVGYNITSKYKNSISSALKAKTYKIEKTDSNEEVDSEYYKSAYASKEELREVEEAICEETERKGATLLINKNNALPLSKNSKFSCFSHSSVDLVNGGTGSGQVDTSNAVTLRQAIENEFGEGSVNSTLWRFYKNDCVKYSRVNGLTTGGSSEQYLVNEVPWENISTKANITSTFNSYGDVALVVLSRSGGEGNDLPFNTAQDGIDGNFLALTQNEIDMLHGLKQYKDEGIFKKIVVLFNSSNSMEMDFLEKDEYGIDAAMWIGEPGLTGLNAVAKILSGTYNPSGRLVDTFLKDNLSSPAMVNFGMHDFTNKDEYDLGWLQSNDSLENGKKCNQKYHVYQEGIYIGYRYYETRYEDYVMNTGNTSSYNYDNDVAFPFGYNLGYTNFEYSNFKVNDKDTYYEVNVTVTNVGNVKGDHSVDIYSQSPYTTYDKENGIEKEAVKLVGIGRTGELQPNGGSETLTIKVEKKDMATYDANKEKTYIMEDGNYYLAVGDNAHNATNNILAAKGYTKTNTNSRMDEDGNQDLTYKIESKFDNVTYSTSTETGYKITNQFENADLNKYEGTKDQKITYLSRNDWENTFPKEAVSLKVTEQMWEDGLINTKEGKANIAKKMIEKYYSDVKEKPTMGDTSTSYQLVAFQGMSWDQLKDNEEFNQMIKQATFDEISNVIENAFHLTNPVQSIGLPATSDENGPQGFTKSLIGGESGMCYTSEDVLAATRDRELALKVGELFGEDFLYSSVPEGQGKYAGIYGPGANIHRTPYCGRNFEYYSEDGLLSSFIGEQETAGIKSKGIAVYAKHFFLNDEENGRYGLSTWANEQSIRELYSRGFEGIANAGGGYMTSFGRLGVVWAGSHYGAMTELYQNEWGGTQACYTDCSYSTPYMDYVLGMLAGGTCLWDGDTSLHTLDDFSNEPAVLSQMQEALKKIAYTYANTVAMNGLTSNMRIIPITPWWQKAIIAITIVGAVLASGSAIMLIITIVKKKKDEPQEN